MTSFIEKLQQFDPTMVQSIALVPTNTSEDADLFGWFDVRVESRGNGRYAIVWRSNVWDNTEKEFVREVRPSERDDEFIRATRFDSMDSAFVIAIECLSALVAGPSSTDKTRYNTILHIHAASGEPGATKALARLTQRVAELRAIASC